MNQVSAVPFDLDLLRSSIGFAPNGNQRDAVFRTDGPLFLPAGPGSGKTRVILRRTVNLIVNRNISPDRIFLSTFTEKAAHQLKEGLRTFLNLVTAGTGVQYCPDVCRGYPLALPSTPGGAATPSGRSTPPLTITQSM